MSVLAGWWRRWRRGLGLAALLGVAAHAQTLPHPPAASSPQRPEIRFALGQSWAPPFLLQSPGQAPAGLLVELMGEIAQQAGARARFIPLPPRRVDAALDAGQVDMHCFLSPAWMPEPADSPRWSVALLQLEDVLVGPPGASLPPSGVPDGETVGVVAGYSYPALAPRFDTGALLRDEAPSQQHALDKVLHGRNRYALVNRQTLDWFNRQHPPAQRLASLQVLGSASVHCLLARRTGLPAPQLLAAVARAVRSPQWRSIQQRYR
mgnify:CR=1 FL=1